MINTPSNFGIWSLEFSCRRKQETQRQCGVNGLVVSKSVFGRVGAPIFETRISLSIPNYCVPNAIGLHDCGNSRVIKIASNKIDFILLRKYVIFLFGFILCHNGQTGQLGRVSFVLQNTPIEY